MTVPTRANAAMAATGTVCRTGRRSATKWTRVTQDQALNSPPRAATTGHRAAGTAFIAALARLKVRNDKATQPTAPRRHQPLPPVPADRRRVDDEGDEQGGGHGRQEQPRNGQGGQAEKQGDAGREQDGGQGGGEEAAAHQFAYRRAG